jgi:uncharacterized membrane protein
VGISVGGRTTTAGAIRGFLRDAQGAFTPIDAPDAVETQPYGVNNRGQLVGSYADAQQGFHGFLLDAGVFTTIDAPDATGSTFVFDINERGQLAGVYDLDGHGYLQDRRGNFTTIDHPEGFVGRGNSEQGGINNRGQIVGNYRDATGTVKGFLLDKQGFTSIEVPGALRTIAAKINDHGQIVGAYGTLDDSVVPGHGYLWYKGVLTTIDVPDARHTQAFDIDNHGRIVGEYQDAAGMFHGFLRDASGRFIPIDAPGATATVITGINDRGQMIGLYLDVDGTFHAFLLEQGVFTPIDVPNATVTFLGGINNHGQVVGVYRDAVGLLQGFMLRNGTFTTPTAAPGAFSTSYPWDINDRGAIVGFYF